MGQAGETGHVLEEEKAGAEVGHVVEKDEHQVVSGIALSRSVPKPGEALAGRRADEDVHLPRSHAPQLGRPLGGKPGQVHAERAHADQALVGPTGVGVYFGRSRYSEPGPQKA